MTAPETTHTPGPLLAAAKAAVEQMRRAGIGFGETELRAAIASAEAAPTQVVVIVVGGVVQEVYASTKIALRIIDHDNLEAEGKSRAEREEITDQATAGLDCYDEAREVA